MSLGVAPRLLMDKPLRKCLLCDCVPLSGFLFHIDFPTYGEFISDSALCISNIGQGISIRPSCAEGSVPWIVFYSLSPISYRLSPRSSGILSLLCLL